MTDVNMQYFQHAEWQRKPIVVKSHTCFGPERQSNGHSSSFPVVWQHWSQQCLSGSGKPPPGTGT